MVVKGATSAATIFLLIIGAAKATENGGGPVPMVPGLWTATGAPSVPAAFNVAPAAPLFNGPQASAEVDSDETVRRIIRPIHQRRHPSPVVINTINSNNDDPAVVSVEAIEPKILKPITIKSSSEAKRKNIRKSFIGGGADCLGSSCGGGGFGAGGFGAGIAGVAVQAPSAAIVTQTQIAGEGTCPGGKSLGKPCDAKRPWPQCPPQSYCFATNTVDIGPYYCCPIWSTYGSQWRPRAPFYPYYPPLPYNWPPQIQATSGWPAQVAPAVPAPAGPCGGVGCVPGYNPWRKTAKVKTMKVLKVLKDRKQQKSNRQIRRSDGH